MITKNPEPTGGAGTARRGPSGRSGRSARRALLAASAAACLLFPACPGGNENSGKITLTYTLVQGDTTPQAMRALNLSERMPDVVLQPLTVPGEVLSREPYVLSLSTGSSAIDAYLLDAPWVKSYSATGWLAPLSGGDAELDLSSFRQELIEMNSLGGGGPGRGRRVLAIPFETKGNILFYRKDLLEAFGYQPPATWRQLITQCQRILEESADENLRWGFLFHGVFFINDFYPIMWGFGGGIFDESGKLVIDCPENVRALAMIKTLQGVVCPAPGELYDAGLLSDYNSVEKLFAAGDAVFMINWNIRWGDLEKGLPGQVIGMDQVGVAPIPSEDGNLSYSNIGSFGWGINYFSSHREQARRFILLITSFEAQRWRALHNGVVPARWDVLSDPEVAARAPSVLRIARVFEKVQLRARPYQREINERLNDVLIDTILNDLDPLEVLSDAQEFIADRLRQQRGANEH